ncbi:hypothetical protein PTSG_04884 [Salpingoeca rosetta]|uniref:Cysteine and histidine-rich domain-containing protein 1 n=1 Tax=Salpingoeca rosetta (strain ATCC 50818 / BSB-021) TaxID=946362 RepID=F2U8W8_SALR5|nr:uncharacterized protein PTSG_04884 [Salpingoeca rosetta]EGD73171.1 hypothetical protein PTSG_04884 [Salpingoeca rosetta]|eukprot:XP_004994202.1 hypothetical protein PTSG_04884 [Salpingoeca rosetta]
MPLCLHRGCGKEYSEEENKDGDCRYHPGTPIFHEGLKGWSCCNKRFTDFSEFLAYPGCTYGEHSDVPPDDDVDANAALKELSSAPIDRLSLEQQQTMAQVRDAAPKVDLDVKVTPSLERALEKFRARQAEEETDEVKPGQPCTNNACNATYVDEMSNEEECLYHPGAPVFHEGYKYWSCCPKKKTYEFDEFLEFKGCTTGKHCWVKPKTAQVRKCRHDWFQSDDRVSVSIYAKCIDPEKCSVKANSDSLTVDIVYEDINKYTMELHLGGKIDPSKSSATLTGTKLDLNLVKASPGDTWADLEAST